MPVPHSPPSRKTRSQARAQAVLTPTPTAPLDVTPAEGRKRTKKINFFSGVVGGSPGLSTTTFKGSGKDGEEEEENSVEEEQSDATEGVPDPVGASQGTGGPTLAQSHQPVSNQSEPSSLAIVQKMTQIMVNFQAASSSDASRPHL
ncbi:hypothetical protein O181_008917 [Austropuccinia psidii MF-1]|uniref:Uncharacterized protein n=1 Tax=Austropuccinia psidii MF-1 TaxID=1389203 RepID=A0A9Q3BQP1_9BASI|nr:hypothetical protein [Austropuccinia psidii MF-1]